MPILTTPPKLLDSTLALANGKIAARVTAPFGYAGDIVTTTQGLGQIVGGEFRDASGAGPFVLPVTPAGVAVELWLSLVEQTTTGIRTVSSSRTVSVPNVASVTWDVLVDVVAGLPSGDYQVPAWVASVYAARTATETAAANAEVARVAAVAAAASVPTTAQLNATFVPRWTPSTVYAAGQMVTLPTGDNATSISAHTSGPSTYTPANWALSTVLISTIDGKITTERAVAAKATAGAGRPRAGAVVIIGDSRPAWNGNGSPLRQRATFFQQLCMRTKQRIRYGGVYATSGYTLTQIRDNNLPAVLALSPLPATCFVMGVANDMGGIGGPYNQAGSFAILVSIFDSLRKAGITPGYVLEPPRGDAADADVQKWNVLARRYCEANGVPILDAHTALIAPATGLRNSAVYVAADNVHPDWAGHTLIAQRAITDEMHLLFPSAPKVTSKVGDSSANLIPAGYGLFTSSASGKGTGMTNSATGVTFSIVAPTAADDIVGNWQQMVRATGGAASTLLQLTTDITTGFTAGDKIAFSGRFQTAAYAGSGSTYTFQVAFIGVTVQNLEAAFNFDIDITDGTFYGEAIIPTGATALRPQVVASVPTVGPTTMRVAELTLRNLTTMGASAY